MRLEREREEEKKRMEEEEQRERDRGHVTEEETIKDELAKLTNELGDLNDSMNQES